MAADEWSGRRINCPSCNTVISIPEAPKPKVNQRTKPKQPPPGEASANLGSRFPKPAPQSQGQSPTSKALSPERVVGKEPPPTATGKKTNVVPIDVQPEQIRVAVLTPEVKLDMVHAVRRRLTSESNWLPGLREGKSTYAAKEVDGRLVLVPAKDPAATRFSLIGAFLREFQERNVARTAVGRTKLLDQEIMDGIREVLLDEMSDEERERTPDPLVSTDPFSVSHGQCLAALDVLEELYSQRMEHIRAEKAKRRLGNVRLSDQ